MAYLEQDPAQRKRSLLKYGSMLGASSDLSSGRAQVDNPFPASKGDGKSSQGMSTAQKIEMGVNVAATAADIGLSAWKAKQEADAKAKEDKYNAVVEGLNSRSNAAGNRAIMEQNALHNLMRVGR